jgi:Xaa-Pro aminopeptidase
MNRSMDTIDPIAPQSTRNIARLRSAMVRHQLAAWVVPSSDPHLSEYLPARWSGREWLSGFTGSVGTLVVMQDFAGLWVDSRYWVQADAQLAGSGITVIRSMTSVGPAPIEWLADHVDPGYSIGIDGHVLSLATANALKAALARSGVQLRTDLDLLDAVWEQRPLLPAGKVFAHEAPFAALGRTHKLQTCRTAMLAAGASHHLVSTLDDIAWITNLRGDDVSYNPVFLAHLLITFENATLFVPEGKISAELERQLNADGFTLAPYAAATVALATLARNNCVLVDPKRITLGLRDAMAPGVRVVEAINPSTTAKSRKTPEEIAHVRRTMEQDGAALAEFFSWLEAALGNQTITELTIDERITSARAGRPGFVCPSFATIAGLNGNGAMPHYRATPEAHATICAEGRVNDGLLLIDSGGQYVGGTTDITRVVPIGQTSPAQKRDFTLVLKGMIALSTLRFPEGVASPRLDAVARAPIWAAGVDYGHGTGHGVGYFLNVHEGPHGITPFLAPDAHTAMREGMITSNEPGIYRAGQWGVRIENLLLNVVSDGAESFGDFLQFETLTLCPIDVRCIDRMLLRADEVDWLNSYHAEVARRVAPLLSGAALNWLELRTAAI